MLGFAIVFLCFAIIATFATGYVTANDEDTVIVFVVILLICAVLSPFAFIGHGKEIEKETTMRYLVSQNKVEMTVDTETSEYIHTLKDSSLIDLFNHLTEK